ncbi:hypothetical protein M5X02_20265 [Paenibacillus alvei]|uniref:DUF7352 domain-containing protein n=1 Tax=Paenibacillus alvei TaxID=44250 RepID=UPI00028A24A8|nr:hypothetical protein [Paenibacillus alvei]EJW13943.1 hypothetical protein PAV_141p00490 [Paenibacillus alvei DSM 29]MCY9542983.1 hypothetical protein [Paenibacillus alvei]MCY9707695.1 hypothetical protein [Paenibacillus alvei]MEC0082792.1 hypothetical protein [Paenibacillus alvei]
MKTIYKFPLYTEKEVISLPLRTKILSVKVQRGRAVVYALIDTSILDKEDYEFVSIPTGRDTRVYAEGIENYTFLDTVLFGENQTYVDHVFYRKVAK